jgi:ADP-ribose pyrophosphatase YjhB (NUDIX family)
MFMVTVSVVAIEENGVRLVYDHFETSSFCAHDLYKFPSGTVKAGQESIQFAAVRHVKEQLGVTVKKGSLVPVDFQSGPELSESGNIVNIGFVTLLEKNSHAADSKWFEVDFEEKKILFDKISFLSSGNKTLLARALDVILMMKND